MKKLMFSMDKIKNQQVKLLWTTIAVLSISIVGLLFTFTYTPSFNSSSSAVYKSDITTGTNRMNAQEVWMEQIRSENELQKRRIDAMEKFVEKVGILLGNGRNIEPLNILASQANPQNSDPIPDKFNGLIDDLAKEANIDERTVNKGDHTTTNSNNNPVNSQATELPPLPGSEGGNKLSSAASSVAKEQVAKFRSKGIQRLSISLPQSRANKHLKTIDNYIPAGAFAPAVVLTGVDASTSVQAAGNPRPALLQIMGEAVLPGGHKANIKGCHVTTAVTGDLSSERAEIRIEKISCVEQKTGEVIELNVKGYLAGSDSKAGQRGKLVDRTGPMMRNAAVGGFLSGVAGFLSQNQNPISFLPSGIAQTNKQSTNQLLSEGLSKGAGSALDKYADFYIKRAEQMQPVIEITAGQKVAVVFTEGFSLIDSVTRQAISKANDQERYQQIQALQTDSSREDVNSEATKPIEAWIPNGGNQ